MSESSSKTLLPEGLRDVLPPDAAFEGHVVDRLCRVFAANGYDLVRPPLIEFEDTLLSGVGAAMSGRIFRLLDPVSHRTLGVRTDITTQIARLAGTRLAAASRPLRLMYAGPVLRVRGTQLEPERQFTQAGLELIGVHGVAADAEVIAVTVDALHDVGASGLVVDVALPKLVPAIVGTVDAGLRAALDHKDITQISARAGRFGHLLASIASASGPIEQAIERMAKLEIPENAAREWGAVVSLHDQLKKMVPGLQVTVDTVEGRGFEYHSGLTFSVFAAGSQREIGRGGRYLLPSGEPATGATLLVDPLIHALPPSPPAKRIFVAAETDRSEVRRLQDDGWSTVMALNGVGDTRSEAIRLGCSHVAERGHIVSVDA